MPTATDWIASAACYEQNCSQHQEDDAKDPKDPDAEKVPQDE